MAAAGGVSRITTRRAVLCVNGQIHYADEHLRGERAEEVIAIADAHSGQPYCGSGPHYLAEQTTTVSEWKTVSEGET